MFLEQPHALCFSVAADLRALSDEIEGFEGELSRSAQRDHGDIAARADGLAQRAGLSDALASAVALGFCNATALMLIKAGIEDGQAASLASALVDVRSVVPSTFGGRHAPILGAEAS